MKLSKQEKNVQYAVYIAAFCLSLWMMTSTCLAYIINSYPNIPVTRIQQLLTFPSLIGIATSLLVGPLSLKISKKTLLTFSLSLLFLTSMIFALVGSHNFNLLFVGCICYGFQSGMSSVLLNAVIVDVLPLEARADTVAKYAVTAQFGAIFFNIVGGWLASGNNGNNWPRAFWLGLVIVPVIIMFNIVCPNLKPDQANAQDAAANGDSSTQVKSAFPLYAVVMLVVNLFYILFSYCLTLYISEYYINVRQLGDATQCGYITSARTVGVIAIGILYKYIGKIVKNWATVVGCGLCAVGFLVIAYTNSMAAYMVGAFLVGSATLFINPFITSRLSVVVTGKYVTIVMSLFMVCSSIGMYISPYLINGLAGLIASPEDPLGYMQARFMMSAAGMGVVMVLMAFIFPIYMKKEEKKAAHASA